jgi:hypothetical protein
MIGHFLRRKFRALLPLVLGLALVGCGKGTGAVTGKVTYGKTVLHSGKVAFFDSANNVQTAPIQSDGTYTVTGVAPGPAKVTVEVRDLGAYPESNRGMMDPAKMGNREADKPGKLKKDPKAPKPQWIPPIYADPEKSGLTFDVQTGDNHFDIPLK